MTKSSFKFYWRCDNDDIRLSCIKLPQMIGYAKYFDSNKTVYFKASDKKLLKNPVKRVSELMKRDLIVSLCMEMNT